MPSFQNLHVLYERAIRNLPTSVFENRHFGTSKTGNMNSECGVDFQSIPFLDRLDRLLIGSAHFERCYQAAMIKYVRTGTLKNLSMDFSITNGSFLADPYADAELDNGGRLKLYWRNRCQTTRPGMTVGLIFGVEPESTKLTKAIFARNHIDADGGRGRDYFALTNPVSAIPFGQIFDGNGSLAFEMTKSISAPHRYSVFRPQKNAEAFLEIEGRPVFKAWAAKTSGMARTSLVFKVYRRIDYDYRAPNRLLATLEPIIDSATFRSDANAGNGLMLIKYESIAEYREVKAAILGAAFLICFRHCMKDMYRAFENVAASPDE